MDGARAAALSALCLLALALPPTVAEAASPLKIREVYPGSSAVPQAEYVMLQMTASGQGDVDGQLLRFYDAAGAETSSFTIPADVPNGESQRTVLLGTNEAAALGGIPDFTLTSADRMSPLGGAVCFTGSSLGTEDCLTWGSIPIFGFGSDFPDRQSANAVAGGISNGVALRRSILPGCSTYLDAADDSDNAAADFAEASPAPRGNAQIPPEALCPPDTFVTVFPKSPTSQTSAFFEYGESPAEPGTSFECALDWAGVLGPADFSSCPEAGIVYPGPLAEGLHRFAVRAEGAGGADSTPRTYSWVIDTAPPETAIDTFPPEPSNGFGATFTYHSSEEQSSFNCQLDEGPVQVCSASGKTYFNLADGLHAFRVWATDNAGNKDSAPAERSFVVQNILRDLTPPDTSILSAPKSPSRSDSASFTYASTEPGSAFVCSLNNAPFAPCAATGTSYTQLKNGTYIFAVGATDPAGNPDSLPATYAWTVAAPLPKVTFRKAPPGNIQIRNRTVRAIKLSFELAADKPGSSFRCRIDRRAFKPCKARTTISVKPGRHRFEAYAIDSLGNVGREARRIFRVQRERNGGLF